jgi:hypothetical protein
MATAQDRQVHPADEQVQEREVPVPRKHCDDHSQPTVAY